MKIAISMFLVSALLAPTAALSAPPQNPRAATLGRYELESSVRRLLDGYEPLGVDVAMAKLGKPAADVLLRFCRDSRTPELMRLRAIEALGYVPTEAGRAYLHELVHQLTPPGQVGPVDDERVYALSAALRALGGFGASELTHVAPYLDHNSADVREAAVATLRMMPARSGVPLLQQRLTKENDRGVQLLIRASVAQANSR